MPRIIRDATIVEDDWQVADLGEGQSALDITLPEGLVLFPLNVWLQRREEIIARNQPIGVWLRSDEAPEALVGDISRFSVIGIHFPRFTDGRGCSTARLLRERHRFVGEIRAIGDVLQDQLFAMRRCGINAFVLRADRSLEQALPALKTFSDSYQAAADEPRPLFRRRLAGEPG